MVVSVDALQEKIRRKKCPAVLCPDLSAEQIPEGMAPDGAGPAARLQAGLTKLLEAVADILPAVQLNTAYFEALGPAGLEALYTVRTAARAMGYYVLLELNRSDPEPAAEQLAAAYLGDPSAPPDDAEADGVILSAFAGSDGVRPYLLRCRSRGKSVFLQARTANKSAREMQDLIAGGRVVHTVVADLAVRRSTDLIGASGYSSVGLVSGPPYADALQKLRSQYDRLFLIVPGVGGQGMALRDARLAFDKFGHGAAVEAGRVTDAWRRAAASGGDPVQKARGAAERLRSELQQWVQVI